jgi:hypothetical protein
MRVTWRRAACALIGHWAWGSADDLHIRCTYDVLEFIMQRPRGRA